MIGLKKRNIKKMLKLGAKAGGVSFADVQTDIEATIDEAMNSTDPEQTHKYRKISKSCLEVSVPRQKNISIKLQRKQNFNWLK